MSGPSTLKLGWKVLLRRKFFTFVSLFGVGFTLMVLVVGVAILDHGLGVEAPEVHQDRTLTVHHLRMSGSGQRSGSNVGLRFVTDYLQDLPGVERLSYYTNTGGRVSRVTGKRFAVKGTDGAFWKILRYDFLEGGPFDDGDLRDRRKVAVVTRSTADRAFGPGPALGKSLEVDAERFRVVGVVADVSPMRDVAFAEAFIPYTAGKGDAAAEPELLGGGTALLLLRDRAAIGPAKQALRERLARFQSPDPRRFKRLQGPLDTHFEREARDLFGEEADDLDYGPRLVAVLALLAACFMLLPAVNLVNLNVSRILERASEIGVRKAFGATRGVLVGQFLIENLLLTLLGAALGMALAYFVLGALSDSSLLPHARLRLDPEVALAGVGLALVFGLVSGVYPAWRMARLHPVQALKGGLR